MQPGWVTGVGICCAAFVGLAPSVCAAAAPEVPSTTEPPEANSNAPRNASRWYGWQTFASDGAAGALFLTAIAADHNTPLFGFSALTFGFGAPAIHVAHGNWERSLASVGLRLFLPFAGALIASPADIRSVEDERSGHEPSNKWTLVGVGVGGLVAAAADGLLLAYDAPKPKPPAHRNQLLRVEPMPQLLVLRSGFGLGCAGQF